MSCESVHQPLEDLRLLARHCLLVLCLVLAASAYGVPPTPKPIYSTVEELYDAYRAATESRDWKALFQLGSPAWQDKQLAALVRLAQISEDKELREIIARHSAAEPTTGSAVGDKTALFVEACKRAYEGPGFGPNRPIRLEKLVIKHPEAVGESVELREIEERQSSPGLPDRVVLRTLEERKQLNFLAIDGGWYLAPSAESDSQK